MMIHLLVIEMLWLAASLVMIPFFVMTLLVTAAALRRLAGTRPVGRSTGPAPRFLFLIPAHDEEGTILRTVQSCRAVEFDRDRFAVCVIADNCTDGTAHVARMSGAAVFERVDPIRRSKGYALEDYLASGGAMGFDAVVVVDADSIVDPNMLDVFATELGEGHDWLQCYYTVSNPDASWRTRLMTYAFSLINGVWLLGQEGLGLGAALRGNGMCFSTRGLRRVPWSAHGLTEDLEFSWKLRLAGERVRFVPGTRVMGDMLVRGGPASAGQRQRWESGRRALHARILGPLLRSGQVPWLRKALSLVDLLFPSLVGLLLALLAISSLHLWGMFDSRLAPLSRVLLPVHAAMLVTLAAYVLSPIVAMRLPARYLLNLAVLPYYAAWKIAAMGGRRPKAWVRTPRETIIHEGVACEGRLSLQPISTSQPLAHSPRDHCAGTEGAERRTLRNGAMGPAGWLIRGRMGRSGRRHG